MGWVKRVQEGTGGGILVNFTHPHPEFEMGVAVGQGMGFVEKGGEGRWVDLTYDLPSPSPSHRIQNRVWQRG